MKLYSKIILLLCLFCIPASSLYSNDTSSKNYTVTRIIDGDTIDITDGNIHVRIRVAGMDAPESKQDYGKLSKNFLSGLILGKNIQIEPVGSGIDPFGRSLGKVFFDNKDIAIVMIEQGLATYYRPGCVEYPENKKQYDYDPTLYVETEQKAREAKLNIWSLKTFELPCQYRKEKKH